MTNNERESGKYLKTERIRKAVPCVATLVAVATALDSSEMFPVQCGREARLLVNGQAFCDICFHKTWGKE